MWSEKLRRVLDNGVVRQFVVFSADLAEAAGAAPPDPRIRWAGEADREALIRSGLGAEVVDAALGGGGRIAILEEPVLQGDGRLVARNCYWTGDVGAGGLTYGLPADAVFASDGFVEPGFRGQRHLAAIKAFAARALLAAGYRRMVSASRWRNTASTRAHGNAAARPLMRLVVLRGPFRLRAVWAGGRVFLGRPSAERRMLVRIP